MCPMGDETDWYTPIMAKEERWNLSMRISAVDIVEILHDVSIFMSNHRVISKTLNDGRGNRSNWSYSYQGEAYNDFGRYIDPNSMSNYPNSAVLYWNRYTHPADDRTMWLLAYPKTEFQGHSLVVETAPDGAQSKHWFFQATQVVIS